MGAKREVIGSRCSVDIRSLTRAGLRQPGECLTIKWHSSHQGALPGKAMVTMLDAERLHIVHFESDMPEEILDLSYTATAFGGRRAWFQCTKLGCGRRVAVLHTTPEGFRCRHCTHLVYGSPFEQPYDRLLRRMRRIRHRLGGGNNLIESPPVKPKGMHWKRYGELIRTEAEHWQAIGKLLYTPRDYHHRFPTK
ncbi:MAG: hypothetical protein Q8M20_03785 [Rhodocyclaceae bacterium]|nr:hypothetical protein [Rhodocyclaceae bacterium]MDZ4202581.1 hypothetical protein [Gallionella sp.]